MSTAAVVLTIYLHLILHLPVEEEELARARETAQSLLASAGIAAEWQVCSVLTSQCGAANAPNAVSVRLLPRRSTGRPECGQLVRDPKLGTVALVYVVRHRELVLDVRHSPAGRATPSLSTLESGHVTGLAIAHEVGHALNLRHARRGVMKAWIDLEDLRALRESRLAFTPEQSARMRARLLTDLRLSQYRSLPLSPLEVAAAELLAGGHRDGKERITLMNAAGQIVAETRVIR